MLDTAKPLADAVIEKLQERFPKFNPTIRLARMNGSDLPGSPWEILHDNKPTELLIDRQVLESQGVDAAVEALGVLLENFDYDRAVVKRLIHQFPEVVLYTRLHALRHKDRGPMRVEAINALKRNWGITREEADAAVSTYAGEDPEE